MSMLRILLIIIFLIAAVAVTVIVLLQEGKSAGLGSMTGSAGGGDSYWERNKKHSLEGKFEKWTKITAIVFVLTAFLIMLIPNKATVKSEATPAPVENTTEEGGTVNKISLGGEEAQSEDDLASQGITIEPVTEGEETADDNAADGAATDEATTDDASSENASN